MSSDSVGSQILIRPAVKTDRQSISELLDPFVQARKILRRTRAELLLLMDNGFVAVDPSAKESAERLENQPLHESVVGFAAVEVYSRKLAEIQCLAVADSHQGLGIGSKLAAECVERARQLKVMEVMAISSSEGFLSKIGFDYSLPNQKRALFVQLRSREEVYNEADEEE